MESERQYFCNMLSSLLFAAHIMPAQWLIVSDDTSDSLCNYLGLKHAEEYVPLMIYAKLAYINDGEVMFNWNTTTLDRSKYSINQFVITHDIPAELSEATRLKVHNQKKLRYVRVGNFSFCDCNFTASQQFNPKKPIEIMSMRRLKNEHYALSRPVLKELLIKLSKLKSKEIMEKEIVSNKSSASETDSSDSEHELPLKKKRKEQLTLKKKQKSTAAY